jgi:hypothetical protein
MDGLRAWQGLGRANEDGKDKRSRTNTQQSRQCAKHILPKDHGRASQEEHHNNELEDKFNNMEAKYLRKRDLAADLQLAYNESDQRVIDVTTCNKELNDSIRVEIHALRCGLGIRDG